MFFFAIPINTDAPIYHWPWATLTLVILNVVVFAITGGGDPDASAGWLLEYGNHLHPLQWLTCNFLHFGFMHLVANMIFLWGFGLVVEGKIGWWRYLLLYLVVGVLHAFVEQAVMLGYKGPIPGSGGASGVVYGLLAVSLVWAPKNEVSVLVFFWVIFLVRVAVVEVTIMTFSLCYIGIQLVVVAATGYFQGGFAMGSEVIHLLGAVAGFAVGTLMLKCGWVDCENWDLFAVLKGTYGNRDQTDLDYYRYGSGLEQTGSGGSPQPAKRSVPSDIFGSQEPLDFETLAGKRDAHRTKSIRKIRRFLAAHKPRAALAEYEKSKRLLTGWHLDEADLSKLAAELCKTRSWSEAVPLMEEFIERFPARSTYIRFKLAEVAIEVQRRPRYALTLLEAIPRETLTETLERRLQTLALSAQQMVDQGVIELDGQAWS